MLLILKALIAGVLAFSVVLVANAGSHKLAGLLISFPAILMSSVFVISATSGKETAMEVIKHNMIALPVWLVTVVAMYVGLKYYSGAGAIIFSLGIWLVAALIFMRLNLLQ